MVHIATPAYRKRETEESEILGHPWLHGKLETSLGYTKPCLKQQEKEIKLKKPGQLAGVGLKEASQCHPVPSEEASR